MESDTYEPIISSAYGFTLLAKCPKRFGHWLDDIRGGKRFATSASQVVLGTIGGEKPFPEQLVEWDDVIRNQTDADKVAGMIKEKLTEEVMSELGVKFYWDNPVVVKYCPEIEDVVEGVTFRQRLPVVIFEHLYDADGIREHTGKLVFFNVTTRRLIFPESLYFTACYLCHRYRTEGHIINIYVDRDLNEHELLLRKINDIHAYDFDEFYRPKFINLSLRAPMDSRATPATGQCEYCLNKSCEINPRRYAE